LKSKWRTGGVVRDRERKKSGKDREEEDKEEDTEAVEQDVRGSSAAIMRFEG
jgi:hypothetical protein